MVDIAFIIQARTNSSRLPKKVITPFYLSNSILDILILNLKKYFSDIDIIVATTTSSNDDKIIEIANQHKVFSYRGDEENVLKRFVEAGEKYAIKNIIRICADNPFLNMNFLNELIQYSKLYPDYDYFSFKNGEGTPVIKTHYGLFAEIVKLSALQKVLDLNNEKFYLEHVTNYLYLEKGFNLFLKELPEDLKNRNDLRFTIDDKEDFENLNPVYKYYLESNSDLNQTISYIDEEKEIKKGMIENIKKYSK